MPRDMTTECYDCRYRRPVPGDAHSCCVRPDFEMTGNSHGRKMGWFLYPLNYDPVWKTRLCANFEEKQMVK